MYCQSPEEPPLDNSCMSHSYIKVCKSVCYVSLWCEFSDLKCETNVYINLEETSDQSNEKIMNNPSNSILTPSNQPKFEVLDGIRSSVWIQMC